VFAVRQKLYFKKHKDEFKVLEELKDIEGNVAIIYLFEQA